MHDFRMCSGMGDLGLRYKNVSLNMEGNKIVCL